MEGVWVYGVPKMNMIKYLDNHDVTKENPVTQKLELVIPEVKIFLQLIIYPHSIICHSEKNRCRSINRTDLLIVN